MTDHKKPGVAFWAAVMVVVLAAYPLSTGPLVWLDEHGCVPQWIIGPIDLIYAPLEFAGEQSRTVHDAFSAYWKLWGQRDRQVKNAIPR